MSGGAIVEEPEVCPACGSDDLGVFAAADPAREDEADIVECHACRWTAPLTPEGAADLARAE
jgi:Zn ribbon nucleic-acid-binding protein